MKDKAIKEAMNSIENRIRHVYNQGYEDGLKDCMESVQIDESNAYEAGLGDAWELARKLSNLGFNDTRKEIFGEKYGLSIDIIKNFSVDEVAAKIKEYEEKQKMVEDAEIKVGDEVIYCGDGAHDGLVGVVIGSEKDWREVRFKCSWSSVGVYKDTLRKTGRHFPQIEEVLEQMKGEMDDIEREEWMRGADDEI